MSILPVIKYPHPLLKTKCKPVSKINAKISKLIDDMIETIVLISGMCGYFSTPGRKTSTNNNIRRIQTQKGSSFKSQSDGHGESYYN